MNQERTTPSHGSNDRVGQVEAGYELLETLGQGGFGTVYRARQVSTGQSVAVKMLRWRTPKGVPERDDGVPPGERQVARFAREMEVCAQLHHPNIVRLLDRGQARDGSLFLVFELLSGETLGDLLLCRGWLPAVEAGALMGQVLDALACAHDAGIAHRDLKPENIMVSSTGTGLHAKVLDFGVGAFVADARNPARTRLTLTGEALGTPMYSAPEQLRGEPVGPESDIYAWALVFLECLTGERAMTGATLAAILHKQLSPIEVPLAPGLADHPLGKLLRRALRKRRRERASDAQALAVELSKLQLTTLVGDLRGRSNLASPASPASPAVVPPALSMTAPVRGEGLPVAGEKRQLTVLCCSLSVTATIAEPPDWETLDALQQDQLNLCSDTVTRFGGHVADTLGDRLMVYFGHPHATDTDARRAARTALELAEQVSRRSALLEAQHGVALDLRVGLHTGLVMLGPDGWPTGLTPNVALRLESLAEPGTLLVSEPSRQLLDRHLDTEPAHAYPVISRAQPLHTYRLLGERASVADRPLVGRTSELAELRAAWSDAQSGAGMAVLVSGEAGIGKSRLVRELRAEVRVAGDAVRDIRCLPEQQNSALFPVLELFRQRWRLAEAGSDAEAVARIQIALSPHVAEPDLVLVILCTWLGLALPEGLPPSQHSPQKQKQLLLDALVALTAQPGAGGPVLVIVEDLHWADPTSLEFMKQLMAYASTHSMLVIMTARPEFIAPWAPSEVRSHVLGGLAAEHGRALLRGLIGDTPIADDVLAGIVGRTDGVPLYFEELTRTLLDTGALVERDGQYVLDSAFDAASVPVSLRDLLTGRLDRLGPARDTAQLGAAFGREFEASLLFASALRDEAAVQADLDALTAADLLIQQRRVQGSLYRFRHALIRDVAYDSMLRGARERTHARIADVLESEFPEFAEAQPAELGRHHAGARAFAPAVSYVTQAAQRSLQRSVNAEALAHTENGLAWAAELDGTERVEAELQLNGIVTQALMAARGWADPAVKATVDRSQALLGELEDSEYRIPTLWSLFFYHFVAINRPQARAIAENLVAIAEDAGDQGLAVAASSVLGMSRYQDGNYTGAVRALEQVVESHDPERDLDHGVRFSLDSLAISAPMLSHLRWYAGDTQEAFELVRRGIEWARGLDHIPSLAMALMYSSLTYQFSGDRNAVKTMIGELLAKAREFGLPAYEGYGTLLHCWAIGSTAEVQPVIETLTAIGCDSALTYYASLSADSHARQRDWDAAIACIDHCLAMCRDNDEHYYESELHRRRAEYLLQRQGRGDAEAARVSLGQAADLARRQGWPRIEYRAMQTLVDRFGQRDVHHERLQQLIERYPALHDERYPDETSPLAKGDQHGM